MVNCWEGGVACHREGMVGGLEGVVLVLQRVFRTG